MRLEIQPRAARSLLTAVIAFGAAAALAQNGVTITQSLEASVKVGMSSTEVDHVLGRPARTVTYRDAAGPTWTYRVAGAPFGTTDFDVSFDADGRVVYFGERILGGSGR